MLGLAIPATDKRLIFATHIHDVIRSKRIDCGYHRPFYKTVEKILDSSPNPIHSIGEICYDPVGGATPRKGDQELYATSGVKFLRILNIKPNEFDLNDIKYIQADVHQGQLKRSQLDVDDVLMTITGRVGTAAVVRSDLLPANINQHIVRLRLNTNKCLPDYLAAYLNTVLGLMISNRSVTGGTRIALDYGAIKGIPIPIPSQKIQKLVISEVHNRREKAQRLRAEAETVWQDAKKWFEEQLLGSAPL